MIPRRYRMLLLTAMPLSLAAQDLRVRVEVRLTPAANLAYQLDCVGGITNACAIADYQALWQREFLHTRADSARLTDWSAIRRRYQVGLRLDDTARGPVTSVDIGDKLRIAALQSTTIADLLSRMELFLTPTDWLRARDDLLHFEPAFMRWWSAEALPQGRPFADRMTALLEENEVSALLGRFARLYGTPFPREAGVPMQLFYRPGVVRRGSSGQQIERYAMLEFFADESPRNRIDVAVHELCHFFWGTRSVAQQQTFDASLHAQPSSARYAARNVFNEGMATALGNGIMARTVSDSSRWRRLLSTPLAFYNNPSIDKAGRALIPIADSMLATGATIDDPGFAARYVAAVDAAFGATVTSPVLLLNELYLFTDAALGNDVRPFVRRTLGPSSVYSEQSTATRATFGEFRDMPDLNALFVVMPSALPALVRAKVLSPTQSDALSRRALRSPSAMHVARRTSGAWVFVVVARDAASVRSAIESLAATPTASLTP